MNDLYTYQLETENKQLREALHTTRKVLEEEIATKKKAIEYIKENKENTEQTLDFNEMKTYNTALLKLLEILGDKDNTITLNTKDMNITGGKYERPN